MASLKNRVALVTGAGKGIGRSIAQALHQAGAQVAVNDVDAAAAHRVAEAVGGLALPADVTDRAAVTAMVHQVVDTFGSLDILVANAGVISVHPVLEMPEAEWDRVLTINAKGVFLCCQAAARVMVRQKAGRIVVMGSNASKTGEPYISHYCASKFAVLGFVQALALELAPHHINVNCVCPVNVETELTDHFAEGYARVTGQSKEELLEEFHREIPWGRIASPQDVANVVLFLASDQAAFLTGQGINVSGGLEVH